ncbi:MAG: nucleotidyltransferase family protein [Oscillospiraceae bacterium]|nr:nucleotidyltransferase family protein [Oscillospiraceae bacterium]
MIESSLKYLSALRSFVQRTAPEPVRAEEWDSLISLAHINSTVGILCSVYMNHPDRIPAELRPPLRRLCHQEIALYAQRSDLMRQLAAEFDRNGIDFILFKGFVVRDYYPIPEFRTFSDVDFVIRRADRERSDVLMKSLGYEPRDTWEPVYSYLRESEYYEIHTDVMEIDVSDKADYVNYYSHIWEHVRPAQVVGLNHALEFTPEFHFLYLLTHIAKHISASGAGIRMYLDLAFFIRHFGDSIDWNWIRGELEKLCLTDFANVALSAVERWFGVESPIVPEPVAEEVMEDFLEFTLSGGVYGYVGRDRGTVFLKQQNRNEEEVSRFKTLMYHAFPPAKVLTNKYTYLEKQRWLLPVAWAQRLIDSRKEWGRFAGHTKDILTADEEKVLKLKRIYKEIGL